MNPSTNQRPETVQSALGRILTIKYNFKNATACYNTIESILTETDLGLLVSQSKVHSTDDL